MGQGNSEEWKGYKHQLMQDKSTRGVFIDGTEEKGATKILRHPRAKDGLLSFLENDEKQPLDTAWKLFHTSYKAHPKNDYTGFRPFTDADNDPNKRGAYQWMSYQDFGDYCIDYGCGLRALGIEDDSNIGIFSLNRPEWYVAHLGNLSQNLRSTALYDTLGPDAVAYIVHHAQVPVIVTERCKLKTLFTALEDVKKKVEEEKEDPFSLKYIVQVDVDKRYGNTHETVSEEDKKTAQDSFGVELIGLSEILEKGRAAREEFAGKKDPKPDDIAYIMYTSGTTGNPKGVVLKHESFATVVACLTRESHPTSDDIHVSYLPLAHIFEAACMAFITAAAGKCAYYQGNIRKIGEDWKEVRPTILIGVPRVFTKTYEKFKLKVSKFGSIKKWFVESATESSSNNIRVGKRNEFYDKYVWGGVATEIGFDRVRLTVSGAAPLPPHLAEFLRVILPKSAVQQGYGLTESCAAATICDADDLALGHCGPPMDTVEVRLVDAQECGYLTTDEPHPRGEVQLRSTQIMIGYYRNPEATAKCLNKETGWFSTGDIGRINPNGTVSIIDRRKNLFKTSTGEYIAAEKVEQTYSRSGLVSQICVYGNSFKSFVVAVIVPDAQVLVERLKDSKLWSEDDCKLQPASAEYNARFKEVGEKNYEAIHKMVAADMKQYETGALHKFERIKDFVLEFELDDMLQGFNVANGLLTPTFKTKRPQLLRKYVAQIKELYTKNGEPPNDDENWVN
eukprot:88844_1